MPFSLPGLFDFTTGRASATKQSILQNEDTLGKTNSFVGLLNAFNASQATNDDLEFRALSERQPEGTNILDRFSNVAQTSTNPNVTARAAIQGNALAPLLATTAVQNPQFAQQQGLPNTPQGALEQLYFGGTPFFQNQFNQNSLEQLSRFNPNISAAGTGAALGAAELAEIRRAENERLQNELNQIRQQQAAENERKRAEEQQRRNNQAKQLSTIEQPAITQGTGLGTSLGSR